MAAVFCARTPDDTTGETLRPVGEPWGTRSLDGTNRHCRLQVVDITEKPLFPDSATSIDLAAQFEIDHRNDPIPSTRSLDELFPELPAYDSPYANRLVAARTDDEMQLILDAYVDENTLSSNIIIPSTYEAAEVSTRDLVGGAALVAAGWLAIGAEVYSHVR
jgi:hypothetical protein